MLFDEKEIQPVVKGLAFVVLLPIIFIIGGILTLSPGLLLLYVLLGGF